jgi:Patatin-like phospholipase
VAVTPSPTKTPDPLREEPPADQFCDLVLNGGVASGVVYPWALLELARHYRFKNIGGNSVGAMAATVAAAAEYGRCNGVADCFEPLRRFPIKLAEEKNGKTQMLRLFQPSRSVRRLFEVFLAVVRWRTPVADGTDAEPAPPNTRPPKKRELSGWGLVAQVLGLYGVWFALAALSVLAGVATYFAARTAGLFAVALLALLALGWVVGLALLIGAYGFYCDLRALADNDYGLCRGRSQATGEDALVEWLHRGIQLSAGRQREDPPLTFADLWAAPRFGQAGPAPLLGGLQPPDPGINLQMFASNVTQGRPIRLPLSDANTRLYYHPDDWEKIFPGYVMRALEQASRPYAPVSRSDPRLDSPPNAEQGALMARLRELPSGGMPIVVAARLSLCFPLLFTSVPVYAVDYEAPQKDRHLRRCLLSDGGLCTNFPIHLFDAAHPRWPTFALLLDNRLQKYDGQALWLPDKHLEGRGDNWQRSVPGAENDGRQRSLLDRLLGFAGGMLLTIKDWNDRSAGRLPHVRNRIVRLALQNGEGQLNLAMRSQTILRMAHEYGTDAGKALVKAFAPDKDGAKPAWREHVYIRSMIELRALRRHLKGYTESVQSRGGTLPLHELLAEATGEPPLRVSDDRPDPTAAILTTAQFDALAQAVQAVHALEAELSACEGHFGSYRPVVEPELRLRPPL